MAKLLYACAIIYAVSVAIIFPKWAVDDAYISYRYADNLANHGALTWNVGEDPVDGSTGLAWPVILAGFIRLGLSPQTVSHAIGVISFFIGGFMLWLIFRRLRLAPLAGALTILLYSTLPQLATHMYSGMETMLFLALLLVCIYALTAVYTATSQYWVAAVCLLVSLLSISLVRPEGVALSGLCLLAGAYHAYQRAGRTLFWRFCILAFALYILPISLCLYWQMQYYGSYLPNTYHIKTVGSFTLAYVADFYRYLVRFFLPSIIIIFILVALDTDSSWVKIKEQTVLSVVRKLWPVGVVIISFVLINIAQFTRSHLSVNFSYRYYMPLLSLVWILLAVVLDMGLFALRVSRQTQPKRYYVVCAFVCLLMMYQVAYNIKKLPEEIRFAREQIELQGQEHNAIGKILKEKMPANEWLAVYMDAGAIPYFSGLKTIDLGGLNDETLAHNPGMLAKPNDYMYAYNPGAIVISSHSQDQLPTDDPAISAIALDTRFKKYQL
ncbi:MAG: hypothetical protein EXS55_05050, partial [Candidatus Magasanikbacteria bacterium]|nr:hypothetical protein [Candidatus Magasanikbacteria bacterium]